MYLELDTLVYVANQPRYSLNTTVIKENTGNSEVHPEKLICGFSYRIKAFIVWASSLWTLLQLKIRLILILTWYVSDETGTVITLEPHWNNIVISFIEIVYISRSLYSWTFSYWCYAFYMSGVPMSFWAIPYIHFLFLSPVLNLSLTRGDGCTEIWRRIRGLAWRHIQCIVLLIYPDLR